MNDAQLDALLSQPLAPIADNGFAALLLARIKREERRRAFVFIPAMAAAGVVLCLMVPLQNIIGDVAAAVLQLAVSPMVGLAVAASVLTFLIDRVYTDRRLLQV